MYVAELMREERKFVAVENILNLFPYLFELKIIIIKVKKKMDKNFLFQNLGDDYFQDDPEPIKQ